MKSYLQTPAGIMRVLDLFQKQQLHYLLFKCDHIFAGQNKNLDILFETNEEYALAGKILQERGFRVRLSEKIERYKTMYTGLIKKEMFSIHLHREIAWHGMIALDKKEVFQHKKILAPLIIVPGLEDSILIHAAHVLFENFEVTDKERTYLSQAHSADKRYLRYQVQKYHWNSGFQKIIEDNTPREIAYTTIALVWAKKLVQEPLSALYLSAKLGTKIRRSLFPPKSGLLIALIGVNGTGKTTLAKKTLEGYAPYSKHWGYPQHYYYFGWNPEFFLTKIISRILQKKRKHLFEGMAINAKTQKFSLFQELIFLYTFAELYYRYLKNIKPKLQQGGVVISDRYFYDIYGQYPYAPKSIVLKYLLRIFPKPDYTFLLNAPLTILQHRGKENRDIPENSAIPRQTLPSEYLLQQQERYINLKQLITLSVINTEQDIHLCAQQIIEQSWRKVI